MREVTAGEMLAGEGAWQTGQLLQLLFYLGLVFGLAYLAARFLGRRFAGYSQGRYLRLIEVVPLGPNRNLCLASVAGKVLVLGVSERGITCLAVVEENELIGDREAWPTRGSGRGNGVAY